MLSISVAFASNRSFVGWRAIECTPLFPGFTQMHFLKCAFVKNKPHSIVGTWLWMGIALFRLLQYLQVDF